MCEEHVLKRSFVLGLVLNGGISLHYYATRYVHEQPIHSRLHRIPSFIPIFQFVFLLSNALTTVMRPPNQTNKHKTEWNRHHKNANVHPFKCCVAYAFHANCFHSHWQLNSCFCFLFWVKKRATKIHKEREKNSRLFSERKQHTRNLSVLLIRPFAVHSASDSIKIKLIWRDDYF